MSEAFVTAVDVARRFQQGDVSLEALRPATMYLENPLFGVEIDGRLLARAELEQSKANQKLAKAKFDRAVELKERNFISGQAKDEAENAMRVADATVKLSEAKLTKLLIKAPFSGTVGLRTAGLGDYVKDGQDIVNLEKIDPIKVDFKIPEVFQSKVRVGQLLAVTLDALPGQPFNGNVYAVNPQLDTAGRAVVLRAQMTNKNGRRCPTQVTPWWCPSRPWRCRVRIKSCIAWWTVVRCEPRSKSASAAMAKRKFSAVSVLTTPL